MSNTEERLGRCYQFAGRKARELMDKDAELVHGTLWSENLKRRINHAWIEMEDLVYEPNTDRWFTKDALERIDMKAEQRYPIEEGAVMCVGIGHWGPYTDEEIVEFRKRRSG